MTADLLVVGAGPTGLSLALQAHHHGARVRVVERRPEMFRPSRALILHPRTLEVLRPLGVTNALLGRADTAPRVNLHLGTHVMDTTLADLALPDTAFPHLSLIRQTDVETVLTRALEGRGVSVERGTELLAAEDQGNHARAFLRSSHGAETIRCTFVVGCDGPDSAVRDCAGIGWRGRPYAEEVVLADLDVGGIPPGAGAQAFAGRQGLLFLFPLGEQATWRLLATRASAGHTVGSVGQPGAVVPEAELHRLLSDAGTNARIERLAWSARVPLRCGIARRFRRGRLFVAGDAAHNYSPATGQGMNAGIQDAVNLGWKLAFAASNSANRPTSGFDAGELALRPGWPSMFRGYLHDDERYEAAFADGWYLTGEVVRRDADGWYWFVGRADDVIKSAGHLIGPFEVESALLEHPAVAEVGVIGRPDPVAGNVVKAFVSLAHGAEPTPELNRTSCSIPTTRSAERPRADGCS
ncbi:FAD-dependent monooxygenase [Streptomyces rochei]